ncbi:vacuolar protein 8-like [Miscanthus floridulus]|uniref:vacuolar protein 8-like n=1 Tax=Miscanthus floridulus TaxID=154761 RepID=UPI0034599DD1
MGEAGEEESAAAPAEVSRQAELDEQRCLAEALDAISSLVSASLSATLFPLKWQLIRDRLNRLHAGLADITVPEGDENGEDRWEAFSNLLLDIAAAAREARELVPRSQGRHYGGGKLRLRSDLDVLAAGLDAHVARLDEVYASGALTRARALVVPRPGAGATRDDVRFYVRDLFARLRVGGAEMRREAAAALSEALRDDEKCVSVVASDVADGVGVLVALLECPDARVQEEALEAVSVIAGSDAHRGDLVVGGAIAPVVRVLDSGAGSEAAKESAVRVLCRLTENSDNAWAVAAHGGVTALLDLCTDHGASGGELVCAACRVLRSLAGVDEIRKYMVADAGAVPVLVSLSQRATDDAARIQAMELLAAIGSGDSSAREAVVQEGAVESLVRALDPSCQTQTPSSSSSKVREVALRAIDAICLSPPTSTDRLLAARFLNRVVSLLRNVDTTLQHCALKAAHRLCQVSEEIKKAMGDAGFMPELVSLLGASKSPEAREMAAESLCALVSVHRNRKRFVQDDRDVARVLQLLGPDEEKPTPAKRFLLSTVMHLTDSSSGRRKIMSSEHVRNLEKLAETDVPDAKRIVKRLGGSRLRSIFHGIWRL